MGKNIILCSDGTGNTNIEGRGSNVFKLYEAIDRDYILPQIAYYDDGVGTESYKPLRALTGALGLGLSHNVRDLYTHLVHSYEPGDHIFIFGFSRGAYTARTLAAFILECGIMDRHQFESEQALKKQIVGAYKAYRRKYNTFTSEIWQALFTPLTRKRYGFIKLSEIKDKMLEEGNAHIEFIGVWDTVSALGVPYKKLADFIDRFIFKFKFPNNRLNPNVKRACHAVSIDDKRKTFHPEMWDEEDEEENRIEQVWFPGVHSNVGGGYPQQGLSLTALDWMVHKANQSGLHLLPSDRSYIAQHANIHDKLYNSRANLAAFYPYSPRDIFQICKDNHVRPDIHESTYYRALKLTNGYAPGNLPKDMAFVDNDSNIVLGEETKAYIEQLNGDSSLINRVKGWIHLRQWLQAIFIVLTGVALYIVWPEVKSAGGLPNSIGEAKTILQELSYAGVLLPMILVYILSTKARSKMQQIYSRFWYDQNKNTETKSTETEEKQEAIADDSLKVDKAHHKGAA